MQKGSKPQVALVVCGVLRDEFAVLAASRPHVVHTDVLQQGLHNTPALLQSTVQEAVDRIEASHPKVEAILLGYGLCARGTENVVSRKVRLVLPRAHDCVTLLLGSRERYMEYVKTHPGAYWYSPGWNREHTPPGPERYYKLRRDYADKFGEENADFLMESEQAWFQTYSIGVYVDTGLTDQASVERDIEYTRRCTEWLNWKFERLQGSPALLEAMLDGEWDQDNFLVLQPGQVARMTADDRVVRSVGLPRGQRVAV